MSVFAKMSSLASRLALGLALAVAPCAAARAADVTVFAAASLKDVLSSIGKSWEAETGKTVALSFAASSALAKQIEQGAPADLFVSADLKWMDYLQQKGLIDEATRENLVGNAVVLIAPEASSTALSIGPNFPLAEALGDGRLAMGNVAAVPAGIYGKEALQSLGVWDSVKDKLAEADNVRAALLLVSRGEAPLGIVYATDAKADPGVRVVGSFPEGSHSPVIYPAALLKDSKATDARAFLDYLSSPKATEALSQAGFTPLATGH